MDDPVVTRYGALGMQVCVPETWTDEQVTTFAESAIPCGTTNGWQIRKTPLPGDLERVPCAERPRYVHIVLDA